MASETKVNVEKLWVAAEEAANEARQVLLHYWGRLRQVRVKELAGIVSEADTEAEKVITEVLTRHCPEIPILGEEAAFAGTASADLRGAKDCWFVDPLDGTTNYVHQFPMYAISMGLRLGGELVLGLVDMPGLNRRYSAMKNQGAFCNGEKVNVSDRNELSQCLLATGFFGEDPVTLAQQVRDFESLLGKTRGIRRAGSAAVDLCMVASGVFDAYFETHLQPWDTAGGGVIVQEAGGLVTNYQGQDFQPEMTSILASNGAIHQLVQSQIANV